MKKVLITGAGSFLGKSLEKHLQEFNRKAGKEVYHVERISQRDPKWDDYSLENVDVIFQASGIAHVDISKVSEDAQKLYYEVNCDLAVETAKRAMAAGVKQFIYPSSVIIYGDSALVGKKKEITKDTIPYSDNFYGDSKIKAEQELTKVCNGEMKLNILRVPMVYGPGSKGNFVLLEKLAGKAPVFPSVKNERSMIYVENLCECIRLSIEEGWTGITYPQNQEYVSTAQMVRCIAESKGKKLPLWSLLNPFVVLAGRIPGKIGTMAGKAFGNLTISKELSPERDRYCIYDFEDSIKRTERGIDFEGSDC